MRGSTASGRIAALVAIAIGVIALFMLFTGSSGKYTITAQFQNASQLVTGNQVMVGGVPSGSVDEIKLGDDGEALVTLSVNEEFAPLPRGTTATVRWGSLSSVAGRQIELTLPPPSDSAEVIEDGGTLSTAETISAIDLDQIFNTLDTDTVEDFKRVITGFKDSYAGVTKQANRGLKYANPFLSTSRRVFGELTRDTRAFESLIVDSAKLSGLLAERRADLSGLVGNASAALGAIGRERTALASAINQLPDFMRQANTTFVNLRAALDDLDPLVAATGPVADRLRPFFAEFRQAAADSVPTIRDLSNIVRRKGKGNDLIELTRLQVPLADISVGTGAPDCGADPAADFDAAADEDFKQGALGESTCALTNSLPALAHLRAYTPELLGWFDGFSTSGAVDASGGLGRIASTFNAFTFSPSGLVDLADLLAGNNIDLGAILGGVDNPSFDINNHARCPGTNERDPGDGSTPFTDGGTVACNPAEVPPGP